VFYDVLTSLEKLGEVVDKELESQDGDTPLMSDEFNLELKVLIMVFQIATNLF
jgi:hypothetical protein